MRVLVVEDDDHIRTAVTMVLEDDGYRVTEAESAEAALELFGHGAPDVVLIDVMLPGMDGLALCRSIRAHSEVPILMITARTDSHDVVAGLEAGADDYVTKPFVPKELTARIRAHLRRTGYPNMAGRHMVFGDLELCPDEGLVELAGQRVSLTRTEFRLLCELASNPNRVISREQLLFRVWGYGYFGDGRLVDVHVRRLRMKIETDPSQPTHVLTIRGFGYKLQT